MYILRYFIQFFEFLLFYTFPSQRFNSGAVNAIQTEKCGLFLQN